MASVLHKLYKNKKAELEWKVREHLLVSKKLTINILWMKEVMLEEWIQEWREQK